MTCISNCTPHVAVLLATYNGQRFLDEQFESIVGQIDVEVTIVVGDALSIDGTRDIVGKLANIYSARANVVCLPPERLGPAANFFRLLKSAPTADYYAFADQDDIWYARKLIACITEIEKKLPPNGPGLCGCCFDLVDEEGRLIRAASDMSRQLSFKNAVSQNRLLGAGIVMNSAFRSKLLMYPPDISRVRMHDWWCYLVATGLGCLCYVPERLMGYRQHSKNVVGARGAMPRLVRLFSQGLSERLVGYWSHIREFSNCFSHILPDDQLKYLSSVICSYHMPMHSRAFFWLTIGRFRSKLIEEIAWRVCMIFVRVKFK